MVERGRRKKRESGEVLEEVRSSRCEGEGERKDRFHYSSMGSKGGEGQPVT